MDYERDPVRLGVIGCGVIGRIHLQAATESPLIDVVAVADLREPCAQEVAGRFGIKTIYTDTDSLLADPRVEGVVLAFPARGRCEMALRAFAMGKHVLTEKPVAMNADEVELMIEAKSDLVAGCCSSRYRFLDSADTVTEFIASGALGELRVVRCRAVKPAGGPPETMPPSWRLIRSLNGGGIMANWGCYDLDYLLGICSWSLKPKLVLAQMWTVPPRLQSHVAPGSDAETHLTALIRCEGGTVITYERGEYVGAAHDEAWQIIGDQGSLRLDMHAVQDKVILHDDLATEQGVISTTLWEGDETHSTIHAGPVRDFAEAIRKHRQPKTSLEQALVVQRITDAIYASAERGVAIEME